MSQFESDDYYTVLGLQKNTPDDAAIKKAYRKLAVKWHPVSKPKKWLHSFLYSPIITCNYRTKTKATRSRPGRFSRELERHTRCCRTRRKNRSTTSMAKKVWRAAMGAVVMGEGSADSRPSSRDSEVDVEVHTSASERQMKFSEISSEAEIPSRASSTTTLSSLWADDLTNKIEAASAPETPSACSEMTMTSLEEVLVDHLWSPHLCHTSGILWGHQ